MAKEKSPAFQFYPKDFLTDVNQIAMTLAEVGAYIRLIAHCWLEGSLPDDIARLGRLCGATRAQMGQIWPALAVCFTQHDDGRWTHPRLEKEREKQLAFSRLQSDKGVASAQQRVNRKATEAQPESNRGSTGVQPEGNRSSTDAQPKVNSSSSSPISDLQSASSGKERVRTPQPTPVALAGTLPRDHARHSWCSSRGKCVPDFLHAEFCAAVGGDGANQRLKIFYEAVEHGWPDGAIGDDPVKLWRKEFAAKFPSIAPVSAGKTAGNLGALSRFAERGKP